MFKKAVILAATLCGSLLMMENASAGLIVDVVPQLVKIAPNNLSHSWQHNLLDNPGFVLGSAQNATLSINIYDDSDVLGIAGELAIITVEDFDFDTGGAWGTLFGSAAPGWANALGISAMAALNADGMLDVVITGVGDFWIGDSTLSVETAEAVPEPGTLSMIAMGLLGLAGIRRRKA